MRKLQAFRNNRIKEPITQWELRHDSKAVFHKIEPVDEVQTPDGVMMAVNIRQRVDFADPDTDVAVLVAAIPLYKANGRPDPQKPELWFYEDRFWLKAISSDRLPYYNNKQYVLYETTVENADELLSSIDYGYGNETKEE